MRSRGTIRAALACAGAVALMSVFAPSAGATSLQVAGTFTSPVYVTQPKRGPVLVVEQPGRIRTIGGGTFLDIRDLVSTGGERGLLSVAFPPDYKKSRLLYVYFTNSAGDIEIDEFKRGRRSAGVAKRSSRRIVLTIPHRNAANHNGGQLQFDRKGNLFAATGDGGSTPQEAQNLNSLLGKLLRIDPVKKKRKRYTVPRGNPFFKGGGRKEIYSYGLRNPWRFTIDKIGKKTERIAIADVGAGSQEEVNFQSLAGARGANYGWPNFEGILPSANQPAPPIFVYDHSGGRCAITGGYVAGDASVPGLVGRYLYADLCAGEVRSFIPSNPYATDRSEGVSIAGPSSFGVDRARRIYVASIAGPVYRILP